MAKFYGPIGYITSYETAPGKWKPVVTEKMYSGEFNRLSRAWQHGTKINDDLSVTAEISILADPYFQDHLHEIRYVKLNGVAWKVDSIEPNYPRYTMRIGGIWNGEVLRGEETGTSSETP